jgi:SAM-dependent methyltransferase
LDAGSGVTPLVHVFASREVQAEASDGDEKLIGNLNRLDTQRIYGTAVQYTTQNLTKTSYPDAIFDAISCVSVLEHISAPYDQMAIQELVRILKPGGILVLTVDFTPPAGKTNGRSWGYYWQRTTNLARTGNLGEIGRGIRRKLEARKAVQEGAAQHARSVNQCFEVVHLEDDILPLLQGEALASHIPFLTDLHALSPDDARRFWNMEVNLFDAQGRRDVLPAAYIFRKLKD